MSTNLKRLYVPPQRSVRVHRDGVPTATGLSYRNALNRFEATRQMHNTTPLVSVLSGRPASVVPTGNGETAFLPTTRSLFYAPGDNPHVNLAARAATKQTYAQQEYWRPNPLAHRRRANTLERRVDSGLQSTVTYADIRDQRVRMDRGFNMLGGSVRGR